MKIIPLASDSMGVRSLATYVETGDVKIFIDPSAALGPSRYGLPPHPCEIQNLEKTKKAIAKKAHACDILIISHYHYDHYDPEETFYQEKTIYLKDYKKNINKSQHKRGQDFIDQIKDISTLITSDNSLHSIGDTTLTFSPPFFHGPPGIILGYVIMTTVDDGNFKVLHSSDVQGPVAQDTTDYIIQQSPDLLIMDGPPTLFLGWKFSKKDLNASQANLLRIIQETNCDVILDHHLLRDLKYQERFPLPYSKKKDKIKTFAEALGKKNSMLEAHRKSMWANK
jgi:predicted metallo-beta-lactamase superfamily hydrolase